MGNTPQGPSTTKSKKKDLNQVINFIASHYILTQSFTDLQSLNNEKYCDDMILVTSEVLNKYLTKREVQHLEQKQQNGINIDKMKSDSIMYLNKKDLHNIDVKRPVSKKRMCVGIAKYYIKVAHIFSAITATINPSYTYKNSYGTTKHVKFSDKHTIPKDVDVRINKVNICSERLNALVNNQDLSMSDFTQNINIKPNFCKMNNNITESERTHQKINKTLSNEPGINHLERLYNDIYDYENGEFVSMSADMKKEYNTDLTLLYKAFTGKDEMPSSVTKFNQIPLRDFQSSQGCKSSPHYYMQQYTGSPKHKLFVAYATHTKTMMYNTIANKDLLIGILDKLFVFAINPQTKKSEITINPVLTDDILNELVIKTQKLIVSLYITCETDFVKGLEIFEQIIQEQLKHKLEQKINKLEQNELINTNLQAK